MDGFKKIGKSGKNQHKIEKQKNKNILLTV